MSVKHPNSVPRTPPSGVNTLAAIVVTLRTRGQMWAPSCLYAPRKATCSSISTTARICRAAKLLRQLLRSREKLRLPDRQRRVRLVVVRLLGPLQLRLGPPGLLHRLPRFLLRRNLRIQQLETPKEPRARRARRTQLRRIPNRRRPMAPNRRRPMAPSH